METLTGEQVLELREKHPHIAQATINGVVVDYSYCSKDREDDRFTTEEPGVEYIYLGEGKITRVNYLGKEYDVSEWDDIHYFWKKIVIPKGANNG